MFSAVARYFETFVVQFGQGWNRFWYTPRDPYALGAIRLLTGLIALYVIATYTPDVVRFFGPDGLLVQHDLDNGLITDLSYSEPMGNAQVNHARYLLPWNYLYWFRDSPTGLWVVHIAGLAVLGLFAAGVFSRVTAVAALLVVLTYIHRAPMLTSQVEPILSMVMFYLCLGPSGASFSVDSLLAKRGSSIPATSEDSPFAKHSAAATISTRLMQVHLTAAYAMMGLSKLAAPGADASVWWDGSAVWWLIAKPESRLVDFTWLHSHPYVLDAWTQAIVLFELGFALLVWYRLFRPLMLTLSVVMWGSLALVTGLTTFCLMMLVANLAFVAPEFLRSALRSSKPEDAEAAARPERSAVGQPV